MYLGIVLIAAIPAYLAGGVVFFAGFGWLLALGALVATGLLVSLGLVGFTLWREFRSEERIPSELVR